MPADLAVEAVPANPSVQTSWGGCGFPLRVGHTRPTSGLQCKGTTEIMYSRGQYNLTNFFKSHWDLLETVQIG